MILLVVTMVVMVRRKEYGDDGDACGDGNGSNSSNSNTITIQLSSSLNISTNCLVTNVNLVVVLINPCYLLVLLIMTANCHGESDDKLFVVILHPSII